MASRAASISRVSITRLSMVQSRPMPLMRRVKRYPNYRPAEHKSRWRLFPGDTVQVATES